MSGRNRGSFGNTTARSSEQVTQVTFTENNKMLTQRYQ